MSLLFTGVGATSGGAASNGLLTGLASYWKLEEASGTRADAHGDLDFDTIIGAPGNGVGKSGNAIDLSGGKNYLDTSTETTAFDGATNLSISVWVKNTSTTVGVYLGQFAATGWLFQVASGNLLRFFNGGTSTTKTSYATTGSWVNIIFTFDGSQSLGSRGKLYVDGSDVTSSDNTGTTIVNGDDALLLGGFPSGSNDQDGLMDECAIWLRTLSTDDVTLLQTTFYDSFS
jgi:hypothetical protein